MSGLFFAGVIYSLVKSTKQVENKSAKRILRVGISTLCVCLWFWLFAYNLLYPISLAKHELDHGIVAEETGFIEKIERKGKDRMCLTINNTKYTIVYGSASTYSKNLSKNIEKGKCVKFSYGQESKFIFDIAETNTDPH